MFDRLKSAIAPWLAWFSTFSLPVRFLIGAAVSAIGSAGAVGVITKLGAYWFVLYYGVRTPADGIPYVAETAAVIGVLTLASAALVYLLVYGYLYLVAFVLQLSGGRVRNKTTRVLDSLQFWAGVFGLTMVLATLFTFAVLAPPQPVPWRSLLFFAFVFASGILAVDVGAGKSATCFCVLTVLASFLLWLPPTYGWFLRTIGHGGGRYCTVHLGGEPFPRQIKGYLVVRTGTALLMFDGKDETIEIPLEHVLRIEQPTKVYWCLPGNCTPQKAAQ